MARRTVLVIEDDAAIRTGVIDALGFAGFSVLEAGDATRGLALALRASCDLVLLDLVLPDGDGLDILAEVRRVRPTLPVIVLTARGAADDRVRGLKLGADDYVVKPFSVAELLARVDAVLRRSPERPTDVREITLPAGGRVDFARQEITHGDGARQALSEREITLLRYLAANVGRAISREELLSRVWRLDPNGVSTRTIDMHVARLRDKLRDDPSDARVLITVRGRGYRLAAECVKATGSDSPGSPAPGRKDAR